MYSLLRYFFILESRQGKSFGFLTLYFILMIQNRPGMDDEFLFDLGKLLPMLFPQDYCLPWFLYVDHILLCMPKLEEFDFSSWSLVDRSLPDSPQVMESWGGYYL